MKIIIDVNLAFRWAKALSDRGVEAVHWSSIGATDAQDVEIMTYARQNDYSVFTNDLDFGAILASTRASGPSVIQIRADDTRPEMHIDKVAEMFLKYSAVIEQGTLITFEPNKIRLHILPFAPPED